MIEATVNIRSVLDGIQRLQRTDGRKVFRDARKPVRVDLRDHSKKADGGGNKWPGRAQSTRDRRGNRRKLLGRLPNAFAVTSGADFVRAVSLVRWSQVHNKGGTAGKGSRMPERRFMWVSKTLKAAVRDLFAKALGRAWEGR